MPKRRRSANAVISKKLPQSRSGTFPFLALPPEIRNSIYEYALTIDSYRILYWNIRHLRPAGVTTSILTVNKQIYTEALPYLYAGSMAIGIWGHINLPFRKDLIRRGTHNLRSGREVCMTSFAGSILPDVLARFQKLDLLLDTGHLLGCSMEHGNRRIVEQLEQIVGIVLAGMQPDFQGLRVRELVIRVEDEQILSLRLAERGGSVCLGLFAARQRYLLKPLSLLGGLKKVEIRGIMDQSYADELKRLMEADGDDLKARRRAFAGWF